MSTIRSSDNVKINVAANDIITFGSNDVLVAGNINATGYTITANTITGLTSPVSSASFAETASYALNAGTSINTDSFATTGSNIFNGNQIISGSLTVFTGSAIEFRVTNTGVRIGSAVADIHTVTGSFNISGSLLVNGTTPGGSSVKAGSGSAASFTGSPRTGSFVFTSAFSNNSYAVTVTGEDARSWSIESKTANGFTVNTNSSVALTGPVYWIATPFGS